MALPLGEDALHILAVFVPQHIRHGIDALAAVSLAGSGIDDKYVFHFFLRLRESWPADTLPYIKRSHLIIPL